MSHRVRFVFFLLLSIACLSASAWLANREAEQYKAALAYFPSGSMIGGIPAGGLKADEIGSRLALAFTLTPVELRINKSPVQIEPLKAGLQLDLAGMLAQAGQARSSQSSFWQGFWNYLQNQQEAPVKIPLECSVDNQKLKEYLTGFLGNRYDNPATRAVATMDDVTYSPGKSGESLNIETSLANISAAFCSQTNRVVDLSTVTSPALPPDPAQLRPVLEALIQGSGFDGVMEMYFQDLQSGNEFSIAYSKGFPVQPGIAFTGASTIKIPVMVSVYKKLNGPMSDDLRQQMELMIDLSDNSSTDEVMKTVLDPNIAPMQVSEDAKSLGLENTFLAGFFYPGAPLLNVFKTPANQRTDITTEPDIYNQTTASDMGRLLAAIQRCADKNEGPLIQVFGESMTQAKCQEMISLLSKNKKGVLTEAGLPEGTHMARKYGWVTDPADGLMHQASDSTLVFTPGGNFVLTVYMYHPEQLQWDPAQRLVARLATAIYNYYNQWK